MRLARFKKHEAIQNPPCTIYLKCCALWELVTTLSVSECRACRRFQHSWQRSGLLLWESVLFYCIVGALELLGWDCLLVAFRPELHRLWCILAGACCLAGPRLPGKSVLINANLATLSQGGQDSACAIQIVGILP